MANGAKTASRRDRQAKEGTKEAKSQLKSVRSARKKEEPTHHRLPVPMDQMFPSVPVC